MLHEPSRTMLVCTRESVQRGPGRAQLISLQVPHDLLHFSGHFPDEQILPAIAQLELLVFDEIALGWPELTTPVELLRLKWKVAIRPGDALRVELVRHVSKPQVDFTVHRDTEVCAQGTVIFDLKPSDARS